MGGAAYLASVRMRLALRSLVFIVASLMENVISSAILDIVMNYVLERMFCMPKGQIDPVRGILVTQCSLLGAESR
jgi:hypothetical protein